jgi:hypothetical protein
MKIVHNGVPRDMTPEEIEDVENMRRWKPPPVDRVLVTRFQLFKEAVARNKLSRADVRRIQAGQLPAGLQAAVDAYPQAEDQLDAELSLVSGWSIHRDSPAGKAVRAFFGYTDDEAKEFWTKASERTS